MEQYQKLLNAVNAGLANKRTEIRTSQTRLDNGLESTKKPYVARHALQSADFRRFQRIAQLLSSRNPQSWLGHNESESTARLLIRGSFREFENVSLKHFFLFMHGSIENPRLFSTRRKSNRPHSISISMLTGTIQRRREATELPLSKTPRTTTTSRTSSNLNGRSKSSNE